MTWVTFQLLTFLFAFTIAVQLEELQRNLEEETRPKRQINSLPLVFPYGCTYKLLIGFTAPVKNDDHISLAFAANFQYQYIQFTNITMLSQFYIIQTVSREQRNIDLTKQYGRNERLTFYKAAAEMLDSKGFNGHECMLRAICEAAQYPVVEEGLVGEVIHIILTPDYGRSPFEEDPEWEQEMSIYNDAAVAGRQMFDCAYIYNACPEGQGVLELISLLRDE